MGFGSLIRSAGKAAGALSRSPLGKVAGMVPGLGTAVSAIGLASTAYGVAKGFSGGNKPAGLPALPGMSGGPMGAVQPGQTGGFGLPRGVGGKLQLPWNDPSIPAYLKQFSLDDSFLRQALRAPRGYVVVRDADGRPFALLKAMAKQFKLWHPKPKPPISVRDWHHLRGAGRVIDKLKDMEKTAKKIANFKSPPRLTAPKKGRK